MRAQEPAAWTAKDVARRWLSIYPRKYLADGMPVLSSER